MKTAYLADANQDAVSEAVTERLKAKDALVTLHTHSHVRFEALSTGEAYAFPRSGYVGVFHHTGESDVEMRLKLDARLPARVFFATCGVIIVTFLVLLATNADAGLWSGLSILLGIAFIVTLLLYVGTFRATRALERALFDDLLEHVRAIPQAPREVVSEEDKELARFEDELEAEVLERRLATERKSRPVAARSFRRTTEPDVSGERERNVTAAPKQSIGSRFALRKAKPAAPANAPESAEAKRARLIAAREELERRKRESG